MGNLNNLQSLTINEMVDISGGSVAYDIGHAFGEAVGDFLILYGIYSIFAL